MVSHQHFEACLPKTDASVARQRNRHFEVSKIWYNLANDNQLSNTFVNLLLTERSAACEAAFNSVPGSPLFGRRF
jgi:hypothetical protein